MKNASRMLLEIGPAVPDITVAKLLTDKCMSLTDRPYRFMIDHDIGGPGYLACPLAFDWSKKKHVGIELMNPHLISRWLTKAFLSGYTVCQVDVTRKPIGFPHSIAIARRRAALYQTLKLPLENDDDIPF